MNKALLPALIAALWMTTGVAAAERELLFGPRDDAPTGATVAPQRNGSDRAPAIAAKPPRATTVAGSSTPPSGRDKPAAPKPATAPSGVPALVAPAVTAAMGAASVPKSDKLPPAAASLIAAPTTLTPGSSTPKSGKAPTVPAAAALAAPVVAATPAMTASAPQPAPAAAQASSTVKPPAASAPPMATPAVVAAPMRTVAVAGIDPLVERQELLAQTARGTDLGLQPGETSAVSVYGDRRDLLPMANHLTAKTGVAVVAIVEKDLELYRKRISDRTYPLIHVGVAMIDVASASGYEPLARSVSRMAPALLVRSESGFKNLGSLGGKRLAWSGQGDMTPLAQAAILKADLANSLQVQDMGIGGSQAAINALSLGTADVAMVPSTMAQEAAEKSSGKLQVLWRGDPVETSFYFVRKGAYDDSMRAAILNAVLSVGDAGGVRERAAASGLRRSMGVSGGYKAVSQADIQPLVEVVLEARKNWPGSTQALRIDAGSTSAKTSPSGIFVLTAPSDDDILIERRKILSRSTSGLNVGVMSSHLGGANVYQRARNLLPLSNYMSTRVGAAVNLVHQADMRSMASSIMAGEYPALILPSILATGAMEAGYEPVARLDETIKAGFLVSKESKIAKLDDLVGKTLAVPLNDDATYVGQYQIARTGLFGRVRMVYVNNAVNDAALLRTSTFDATLVRADEGRRIVDSANGELRLIEGDTAIPTTALWVHKAHRNHPAMTRLVESILSPSGAGLEKARATRPFGSQVQWKPASVADFAINSEMIGELAKATIEVPVFQAMPAVLSANTARDPLFPLGKIAAK